MRPLFANLFALDSVVAGIAQEPPTRALLDNLRSNAIYLFDESDSVEKVEQKKSREPNETFCVYQGIT